MSKESLIRNSLAASAGFGLGAVFATLSTLIILVLFGLSGSADAYFVAILLPRMVATIVIPVPQVLIPVICGAQTPEEERLRRRLINNILNHSLALGALVYAALLVAAPWLSRLMAPGFDEATSRLCATLIRYSCVGVPLSFLCEVLGAYLNTRGVFALPPSAEAVRSGSMIVGILALPRSWGIEAAMAGFFVGHILQLVLLWVAAYRKGLGWEPVLDRKDPAFRRVLSELKYPMVGATAINLPSIVQRMLASFLAQGAVAAFSIALQVMGVLFTITLRSVNVATHPIVSRHAAANDTDAMNSAITKGIKLSVLVGAVIFLFTTVLNRDGVAIIAGIKSFRPEDADLLSLVLTTMALALPVQGAIQVLWSPHYALGRARIPSLHMVVMGVAHIGLQLLLFRPFGVLGIALAYVGWLWLAMATGFMILPRQCRPVLQHSLKPMVKTVIPTVFLGVGFYLARAAVTAEFLNHSRILRLAWLGVLACACLIVSNTLFNLFLRNEFRDLLDRIRFGELLAGVARKFRIARR